MRFGDIKIDPVSDGSFRLDGGAVFGVVPRALWAKERRPDGENRILLGLNPLLVRTETENILIETGIGDKGDERFRSVYCVDKNETLSRSLGALGLTEADVTIVINTHLHFDHAGGNTVERDGAAVPAFPNARYFVQRGEWEAAMSPNERTRSSYRKEDFAPVMEAGQMSLIEGDGEITKGVSVFRAPGHNRDIQLVKIESAGMKAIFLSDTVPTTSHLKLPYIMGYDLFPMDTLKVKKELLKRASDEGWLLIFCHDPETGAGYLRMKGGEQVFKKVF